MNPGNLKASLMFSSDEYPKFKQMKADELDIFLSNGTQAKHLRECNTAVICRDPLASEPK
jgi:hypothetical protein